MTGWNVSRHPEWDQMLTAGLTVREIAELCHRGTATIHYHLQRRDHYEPGFRAQHEAAVAARGSNRPSTMWRRRAKELAAFQTEHDRLPRSTGDRAERALHAWLARQRKLFHAGELPDTKVVLLQGISGWEVDPRQLQLDDLWRTRLAAVCQFVTENGQVPRYRTYATPGERALGVWLHNQHQRRTEGKLLAWRHAALNEQLPGWRSRA